MKEGALHELPGGWVWTRLEDASKEFIGGGTPSRQIHEYFGGNIIWLTPTEVPKNKIVILRDSKEKITESGLKHSSARIIPKDSVLLTSRASIGYVAIAGCDVTTNQGFASFVCSDAIYNFFLAYWLWANKQMLESNATGTTFKEISKSKLRDFYLPLPPLPEQRAIVSKIEQLFSDLDNGIENFKKAQARLKLYRQSVLKAACEGKLVPTEAELAKVDGHAYEHVDLLLVNIKEERRKKIKGKSIETSIIDILDLPEPPEGWVRTTLGEIISVHSGEGLTAYQMDQSGIFPVYGGNGITGYHNKFMFEESKLIIGRVGAKCGIVHITLSKCWITDNALIVDFSLTDMKFLFYILGNLNLNRFSVSTAQPVISSRKIYPLLFGLPPLAEQRRIVAEVERRLSVSDKMEATIAESLQKAESLRQSILKKAFEGKLLNKNELEKARNAPDWEPAEKLLERIKAEKMNLKTSNKDKK